MAINISEWDLESLYRKTVREVLNRYDIETSPRGMKTREALAATLTLKNPRARIISSPARGVDYSFAAGEFLWYWQGREDLAFLLPYNKRMAEFSNDGLTLESAYGKRIFRDDGQWRNVREELVRDPDSRRAVLRIFQPRDLRPDNKDVPCTLSIQFFIRDRLLYAHAVMRSNDVFWGLPYDVFSFTLLQEAMMLELRAAGVCDDLGHYVHTAGSLHIYERHFEKAARILGERPAYTPDPMAPVSSTTALWNLVEREHAWKEGWDEVGPSIDRNAGEAFIDDQVRYRWRGGFRRPLGPASPSPVRFECEDNRLVACEDSDP